MFVLTGVHRISQTQAEHVLPLQQMEQDLVISVDLSRLAQLNSCALALVAKPMLIAIIAGHVATL